MAFGTPLHSQSTTLAWVTLPGLAMRFLQRNEDSHTNTESRPADFQTRHR
ncbi:hypothetical protein JOE21_002925 [Desmospora profundinema]|uniref:Uncharacterized protein n=1 Tax=Desmospora profundinema TaxID=1571184 RepID=A0ABU1IQA8_9BACL|nr:hypothetical protein [Desmospora profundinema]